MNSDRSWSERSMIEFREGQVQEILDNGTTDGVTGNGLPIVLLTLRGARSGKLRYTPVMRVEHNGSYAVVGSKGASPEHPAWYYNIKAHPEISLQDGTETKRVFAREVEGSERTEWWQRAVTAYPDYDVMQNMTDRTLPVFVLDPL